MDQQGSERCRQEGREKALSQLEEKTTLGDIAVVVGMAPNGGQMEMHLADAELVTFGGRQAYKGRSNDGRLTLRFVDTSMGYSEQSAVSIVRNLPRQ